MRRILHRPDPAAIILGAALALLPVSGCREVDREPIEPSPAVQEAIRENEFDDADDLLQAIETGTFSERVDIAEEIDESTVPPEVDVEFDHGTTIPPEEDFALRKLADRLEANHRAELRIVGCSDPSGPAAINDRVSQARAEAVAARLGELGVEASRFQEVVGKGENCRIKRRVVHIIPMEPSEETQI